MKIFWGYEDFVDLLGAHHKTGLVLGDISIHFIVFLRSMLLNFQIIGGGGGYACYSRYLFVVFFFCCFFFWGGGGGAVDPGAKPTYDEKVSVLPFPPPPTHLKLVDYLHVQPTNHGTISERHCADCAGSNPSSMLSQ